MYEQAIRSRKAELHIRFQEQINRRFLAETWRSRTAYYRQFPREFAYEILGSRWWSEQEVIARMVARHRRVAVKSANAVGKTYLAADLALWFLYCFQPSIVITTAPTWRQVKNILWRQIRKKHAGARIKLPGKLLTTQLEAGHDWFAIGLATDEPDRFQGFHGDHILIIFDEASGIPEGIWEAAEGVAVSANNKILAIGNPLHAEGQFYRCFNRQRGGWCIRTISALEHPNITGKGAPIPGCVTIPNLESRIADWCEPIESSSSSSSSSSSDVDVSPGRAPVISQAVITPGVSTPGHNQRTESQNEQDPRPETRDPRPCSPTTPTTFIWNGRRYVPNNLFRARVLGEFPDANDESLIPLRWIEAAVKRHGELPARGFVRLAADIARFGSDDTVIGIRIGPVLRYLEEHHGIDTMAIAERINELAYEFHPEVIAVDSIGIGSGVVDRLRQLGTEGVQGINVSHAPWDSERFANKRAELY